MLRRSSLAWLTTLLVIVPSLGVAEMPGVNSSVDAAALPEGAVLVGMAEIDITPDFPVRLAGYAGRMDEANEVIARLSGKALAIGGDDGNGPAMLMPTASAAGEDRATVPAGGHLRLRVLSYNIHHGEGVDRKLDLPRIASVIKSVKPDLVALQEVDQGTERTDRVDQPAELARLTGLNVVFGGNIRYQGGAYGNAVLTRLPISRHKNHLLPRFDDGEQRGVLQVEVELPDGCGALSFLATHLDHRADDRERLASAKVINELVAENKGRSAVLAGDLNDVPDSKTMGEFGGVWTRANEKVLRTIPVDRPTKQIDFILFRPAERWKAVEVQVLDEAVASDHRAIFTVLELLPSKTMGPD